MTDTIKITALSPMGTTIPGSTLTPVVDMSGTPVTKKATIANIANAILSQAGNSYVYAARANLANVAGSAATVSASAQPNITSLGTLTTLVVSGGATFSGDTNLGPVGNVTITGGVNGYVLQTDGTGNLTWTAQTGGGGGNGSPGGANTEVQFNDAGSFGGDSGFTFNKTTNSLTVTGNANIGGTVFANTIQSPNGYDVSITAGTPGPAYIFTTGGAFQIPGGHVLESNGDDEFEIKSNSGIVISSDIANTNQHFSFRTDGVFNAPSNVEFEGTRVSIGPGAANVDLESPTVVINANSNVYVQAALTNENANGSADWVAYGTDGNDAGGWSDFGFTGHDFNDPAYTVTSEGDGYIFVQGYANGTSGGNLILATGDQGNTKDIIFATGGFAAEDEFARFDHSANTFHLTRANSGIQFEDGTIQTTAFTGSAGSELVNGDNSFVLDNDGNVVFEGNVAGQAVDRGLVWDYGANANGVNSMVRQDNNGITVRAWTEQGGGANGYSAPVNIVTNQDATTKTWTFDGSGNLTLPGNLNIPTGNIVSNIVAPAFNSSITGINSTGNANVIITIASELFEGPATGQVTISNVNAPAQANDTWYYEAVEIDQFQLYTDANLTTPVDGSSWPGYVDGGTAVGIGAYSNLTVQGGSVSINSDDKTWTFDTNGAITFPTLNVDLHNGGVQDGQVLQFSDPTQQVIITGPTPSANVNAQRLIIQGQRGNSTNSEGGDVYVWAGDADLYGGDIKIYAGDADDNADGYGGYVNIDGGQGFTEGGHIAINGGQGENGAGGYVEIYAGQGNSHGGNLTLGAGYGTGGPGGAVTIQGGGSGNGLAEYGNVGISAGASSWTFDNSGNLTLPANTFAINYANGAQVSIGGGNTGNVTFDDVTVQGVNGLNLSAGADFTANLAYLQVRAGDVSTHIHLDTGNNEAYDQYFGDDNKFVKLGLGIAGNVSIGTYQDGGVGQLEWTFDSNGNLVLPRGGVVYETNIPFGGLEGNTIALKPSGGTNDDQQLLVYPTAGADFNHLHLTSGNLYNTELFLGDDNFHVKLANTGNIVINTNDSVGNTYQLNITPFGEVLTTGDLFLQTPNGVPSAVTAITGSSGSWESNPVTNLATTNGTGAGLTVNVIQEGGYAGTITIATPGTGYANGDVITVTSGSSSATFTISVLNNQWILDTQGELTLPNIALGTDLDEQTVIQSQRKIISPFRYSAVIDGTTPTVVYTARDQFTTSMKVTIQVQHQNLGMEFFEVHATQSSNNTYYTVSNRLQPPTIDSTEVTVTMNGSNEMQITLAVNSGAETCWVTYDSTEFGIPQD